MGIRNDDISIKLAKANRNGFFPDVSDTEVDMLETEAKIMFGNDFGTNNRVDNGEYFMSLCDMGINNIVGGIAGDSTANAPDEWFDLLMVKLGTRYPDRTIDILHWNDVNQSYDAPTRVQTGPAPDGTVFYDTFTRTASELYATVPDIGPAWGRDGSNAMGDFTIDGSAAVSTADTTKGALTASIPFGNHKITSNITINTQARAGGSTWTVMTLNKDFLSNYFYLRIDVGISGTSTNGYLYKRINGVSTQVGLVANPITANQAATTFDVSLERNGTTLTGVINGNTMTHTLSAADLTAIDGLALACISKGPIAGDKYNDFKVELTGAVAPSITLYNGSMSGSTLAYQQSRLDIMYPVALDLLFISAGHNYGSSTSIRNFINLIDSFISDYRSKYPDSGIIITSQNPQKSPAVNKVPHLTRQTGLRRYARQRGYGYVPTTERWLKQANKGDDLINSGDGVHPLLAGSQLWRDEVYNYLLTKSV